MLKTKFHTTMVMNKYTKHLIPAILAGVLTLYSTSVTAGNEQRSGQAGATELLINPWARSSGWGGINTASVSGLEATFMNVAGMAHTENTELIFSSTSWFSDININAFGFSKSLDDQAVLGLSVMSMNFGDIEITTLRKDGTYIDRRRPESVRFGTSLFEDLNRRDFKINAMAIDPINLLFYDPHAGQKDLESGT